MVAMVGDETINDTMVDNLTMTKRITVLVLVNVPILLLLCIVVPLSMSLVEHESHRPRETMITTIDDRIIQSFLQPMDTVIVTSSGAIKVVAEVGAGA